MIVGVVKASQKLYFNIDSRAEQILLNLAELLIVYYPIHPASQPANHVML